MAGVCRMRKKGADTWLVASIERAIHRPDGRPVPGLKKTGMK
jgi:hypothetical protein